MLILSRKVGEKIIIDGKIEITVASIKKNEIKLGIKAPEYMSIYRKEIFEEILKENKKAQLPKSENLRMIEDFVEQKKQCQKMKGGEK